MIRKNKILVCLGVMLLVLCFGGCANETRVSIQKEEGTLSNMYVIVGANTRLDVASVPDKLMPGSITGTTTLMNVHMIEPTITVNYSNAALKDTCHVGAVCGSMNPELSDKMKKENHHKRSYP